jgi:hypothetical protein
MQNEIEMGSITIRNKDGAFVAQYFWGDDVNCVDRALADGSIYRRAISTSKNVREDAWLEIRNMQIHSIPYTASAL